MNGNAPAAPPAPSSRGEQRLVRRAMTISVVMSLAVAAVLLAGGGEAGRTAAAIAVLLALVMAPLAWRPDVARFDTTIALGVAFAAVAAHGVAWVTREGAASLPLAFVPLILCAAAARLSPRQTLALAAAHGLGLAAQAWATPARAALPLAMQLALLAMAAAFGLVVRSAVARTLERLRRREQRFAGLLAVAADWYWETDAQLRYTHFSESSAGASGLAATRRLGRTPWEIEDFGLDADMMDAHRADLEARRGFADLLIERRDADGRMRCYALSGQPRFDARGVFLGYWGVGREVTAQRAVEAAREASEARYRELFARSPSALVLHRDAVVIDANEAALRLFGARAPGGLVGRALLDFYDDDSRERAAERREWLDNLTVGEAVPAQEFALRTVGGRRLRVQVSGVKVEASDGPAVLSIYADQTERLQAEAARARSEALLAHVVATIPDIITLNDVETARYVMVNDAFVALTGWSREEAIGRSSLELGVWPSKDARDEFLAEVRAHGGVRNRLTDYRLRDGRSVALLVSAALFEMEGRSYLVINGRDVTRSERERLEREAILAHASIGIALTRDRVFQLANPAFEQMFGWTAGSLAGQPGDVTAVDAADYADLGATYGPRLVRGETVEMDRTVRRRDGSTFLCRLVASPVDPARPETGGTIWIAEDVTEQRAVQQALARARDEAEAANRAKSAFLANTSHEIRTPLNGVVGLARLAREPGLPEDRRAQYLEQIDDSARALAGVISDILDLSKIEAGRLVLETTDFDLRALLESIEHGYAALADARALTLAMSVAAGVPRRVNGDPLRVRQVLTNFLSNAVKFTEHGVVRVRVSRADGPPGSDRLRFEVRDSGPGIDAAVQARLFQPFTQADESTTRRFGGTGLGLSICRELAHLMGGEVGVQSRLGEGSLFWAELPLPQAESAGLRSDFSALDAPERPLAGLRVLIVEDNPVNMMIVVALVEQWGVEATQAGNGADAVDSVTVHADAGCPFDLVLMDVQMPVMGGHDATRELRRRFPAGELPIIALTAAALTSEREEALAAGMNDFLTKPIDAQQLHDALLRWKRVRSTQE